MNLQTDIAKVKFRVLLLEAMGAMADIILIENINQTGLIDTQKFAQSIKKMDVIYKSLKH